MGQNGPKSTISHTFRRKSLKITQNRPKTLKNEIQKKKSIFSIFFRFFFDFFSLFSIFTHFSQSAKTRDFDTNHFSYLSFTSSALLSENTNTKKKNRFFSTCSRFFDSHALCAKCAKCENARF